MIHAGYSRIHPLHYKNLGTGDDFKVVEVDENEVDFKVVVKIVLTV